MSHIGLGFGALSMLLIVGTYVYIAYRLRSFEPYIDLFHETWFIASLSVAIAIILLMGLVGMFIATSFGKKEEEERLNVLTDTAKNLESQRRLNKSFSVFFYYICIVELDNDFFYGALKQDFINDTIGEKGKYSIAFRTLVNRTVEESFRPEMEHFFSLEGLKENLAQRGSAVEEFVNAYTGWSRATAVVIERNEKEEPSVIMIGFQRIDDHKKKELQMQETLKAALEAANSANKAKSAFLSKVSHDIRTPLNGIMGMTALASTRVEDKERMQYCLGRIEDAGKHLISIIDEVLDMSRIESGRLELSMEPFSLSELMDNLITMIHPLKERKQQDMIVDVLRVEHEMVIGDATKLQEVFVNLCTNAIKYTPEHGTIKISLAETFRKRDMISYEFIVEDNGIGMSREYQEHMFDPFVREINDKTKNIQGTGLGLPIAKNIITMMDGDLTVESEEGKGSKFKASFYLKLHEETEIDCSTFKGKRVLIVDDNKKSCDFNAEMLDSLGMIVEKAYGGQEGEELFEKRLSENVRFDVAILDWKMPEYDGFKLGKHFIERLKTEAPVIALAAYDWSDIEVEATRCGIMTFISKPFFKSRLVEALQKMLGDNVPVPEEKNETSGTSLADSDFSGKRALLVEDNELNTEIAKELLGMANLEVETAADGAIAVNMFSAHEPHYYDIIFMDIQMPNMNGHEATRAIRALPASDARSIPIIAMSANAFLNDIQESGMSGMNEHISKPIDLQRLNDVLKKWLST